MTETITAEINEWTNPRNGQRRRYVNNWMELAGFEVERYNTGNVRWAALDGEKIANGRAAALANIKVWVDDDDLVHVDRASGYTDRVITADTIRERITAAISK